MRRQLFGVLTAIFLAGAAVATAKTVLHHERRPAPLPLRTEPARAEALLPAAETLRFDEFFASGPVLQPSTKLQALHGKHVRLVGFMAQMELPPTGGFYLVPRPVRCDEAGGGNADLPLESVLVLSEAAAGHEVPFLSGELEVSGVFELGNLAGPDGRVSAFRLRLDREAPSPAKPGEDI